ncbi:uncharacterized protein HMPREF1541_10746 [Cyphellophora europaea CBS 101466]|uniref:Uncharacterized protein n=1 Tax=Cyphellophora europaea (strain CBS 101466) TaxID=1220924 RepID=W2S6E1_CYPE1|nr:uncharacterized protein HMPREF1541_10746 [Cyphellophora europaea CBS 101466]ETN44195.1 hypothetical protein HMPREF1541_10746 [Cyphellophora europaea CBS 101466]
MSAIARSTRATARLQSFPQIRPVNSVRRFASEGGSSQQEGTAQRASPAKSGTSPAFYGVGALLALVSGYYFIHSDKTPAGGHKEIQEIRRANGNPKDEVRDPRDSGVKTLEQKKAKEEGNLRASK